MKKAEVKYTKKDNRLWVDAWDFYHWFLPMISEELADKIYGYLIEAEQKLK